MNLTLNAEYVRGIVENDLSVLKKIYKESLPEVVKYVKRNSGNLDDAKDVFQGGILVIFRKASEERLELTTTFHVFLFSICKRIWLKKLRKKSSKEVPLDAVLEYSYEENFDEAFLKSRKWVLFNKKMMDLTEECRQVLKLLFNKETGKAIAEKMGYTEDYAKRKKYKCKQCQTIKMPAKPLSPIPKSRAGASLLTEVIINKFQRHLPLYRQSQMFRSAGVTLGDSTLCRWCMQVGEILLPLYEAMCDVITKQHYVQVDETPITVLNPNRKGYLWCYYAPTGDQRGLIVYDFHLSRSKNVPSEFLKDYKGIIQVDGYEGYHELEERADITRIGCLTHVRRKFAKVLKISKQKTGIAAEMIERLKPLYAIEKYAKEEKLNHRTRKRLRQKKGWPIIKAIKCWLKKEKPNVPPKSQLGNAIEHFLNQWQRVTQYLRHGIAEIDTNIVENLIRPTAIGKKNYLFFQHEASGMLNGALYSLVQSALLNELEPRTYIHYVLTKAHDMRRKQINPYDLLPHIIDKNALDEFAARQQKQATFVMNALQPPPKT